MNRSIKANMLLLQIATTIILLAVSLSIVRIIDSGIHTCNISTAKNIKILNSLDKIKVLFGHEIQEWKNTLLRGSDKEALKKYSNSFDEVTNTIEKESLDLRSSLGPESIKYIDTFINEQSNLKKNYILSREEFLRGENFQPKEADKKVKGLDRKVLDSLNELSTQLGKEINKSQEESLTSIVKLESIAQYSMILLTIICIIIGYIFANSLTKKLSEVTSKVNDGSTQIEEVAISVSSASNNLSSTISQQAAALQETSAAVEETSGMVLNNSENAFKSLQQSEQSKLLVARGKDAVESMVNSINEISSANETIIHQVEESNRQFSDIINVINEIDSKTKIINEIVFQTKLLSFNASVEAARAGEHGKGFAVVAEEIGNLAQMSGNSAKEITELLTLSTKKVEETISNSKKGMIVAIDSTKDKIKKGSVSAKTCDEILDEIIAQVNLVDNYINEISSASKEQSTSVTEIGKAMHELDSVSHSNGQTSTQLTVSSGQLKVQAEELKSLVVILTSVIEGRKRA